MPESRDTDTDTDTDTRNIVQKRLARQYLDKKSGYAHLREFMPAWVII